MKYVILFSILVLWRCYGNQKNQSELTSEKPTFSDTTFSEQPKSNETDEINPSKGESMEIMDSLDTPFGLSVLLEFEKNGKSRSTTTNDSLFAIFLKSFTTYQNQANNSLYDDQNYEIYNTLIYSDDDAVDPKALEFQDSVKHMGFIIGMTEGIIFLEKDPEFLNRFSPYLSQGMNIFLKQYNLENEEPFSEDGGLTISIEEQINRMIFWEDFSDKNTDFELPEYANNNFEMYLFYLMFGMDNSPIHDWSDSMKIRTELIDAYNSVIQNHPNSRAVPFLKDYLSYIQQKKYRYDRSFDDFGREKFPQLYDEGE